MTQAEDRSYHHGDLRRALLDATRELLVEGGVDAATLRAVARRAGVSYRAPYHHFADKCCLLAAVAAGGFDSLQKEMRRALDAASDDPVRRLQALAKSYLSFAESHPGEFQVMFWHEVCDPEQHPERGEKAAEAFRYLLESIEAVSSRPVPPPKLLSMAISVWSTVHGFATLRAQGAFGPPAAEREAKDDDDSEFWQHFDDGRIADEVCERIAASLARELR